MNSHFIHILLQGLLLVSASAEPLRFSNTQEWSEQLFQMTEPEAKLKILNEADVNNFVLPNPPTGEEVVKELDALLALQKIRTESQVRTIKVEAVAYAQVFGEHSLAVLMAGPDYPATSRLLKFTLEDANIVTMRTKRHFDRVRPSFLDERLKPAIENPGHPSYPSGHATSSFLLEKILGQLWEGEEELLAKQAAAISKNRELAGLHYASDTKAGQILAGQIFKALSAKPQWKSLLVAAQEEWK